MSAPYSGGTTRQTGGNRGEEGSQGWDRRRASGVGSPGFPRAAPKNSRGDPGADPDPFGELLNLAVRAAPGGHEALDLLDPVHHRGVVALEVLADLDEGKSGEFAQQVHGDV